MDLSEGLQDHVTRVGLETAMHCTSTIFSSQDIAADVTRLGSLRVGLNESLYDILELRREVMVLSFMSNCNTIILLNLTVIILILCHLDCLIQKCTFS